MKTCHEYKLQPELEHSLSGFYFPVRNKIFKQTGTLSDLDAATTVGARYLKSAEVLGRAYANGVQLREHAADIGLLLQARSKLAGLANQRQELEISKNCLELSIKREDSPIKIARQSWLGRCYAGLFELSGDPECLTQAILFGREVCESLESLTKRDRYTACHTLGGYLRTRYEKKGAKKDLEA